MKTAIVVVGLAFGDEGKGATIDALARRHDAKLVCRFNGGPQAAHNVITPDGRHHTFAQFGSATFIPGVLTHLSRYTLINPLSMVREEQHLRDVGITDAFERLTVDEGCVVITPFQRALNRITELSRGASAHGSCGHGLGQARSDQIEYGDRVLYAGDLRDEKVAKAKLKFLQERARILAREINLDLVRKESLYELGVIFDDGVVDWCWRDFSKVPLKVVSGDYLKLLIEKHRRVIFEGGQGVLLDETFGTAPYNTWTDTTCRNANQLLSEIDYDGTVRRIGVLRTYFTRHGRGPFPTEEPRLSAFLPEPHNNGGGFQGAFRVGHFDAVQAKYAISVSAGVNEIALNHMDAFAWLKLAQVRVPEPNAPKHGFYEYVAPAEFIERMESWLNCPVTIIGNGPTAEHRREREAKESEAA